ncbi:MAG: ABC transporter permease [Anaerolineales bacterium]
MKALQIAWKDTLTRFRDWKALASMLAAPLLISGMIGLAFGDINTSETPLEDIPVAIVNQDDGELGQLYVDVLGGEDLNNLIDLQIMDDLDVAKRLIEVGELRAVIYVPPGFSDSLFPNPEDFTAELGSASLQLFTDPAADISPLIIQSIVERITAGLNTVLIASDVSARSVAQYAQILGPQMANLGGVLSEELAAENFDFQDPRLTLQRVETGDQAQAFDPFAFFIPGMAVFFLMFSMFDGSRSILLEQTRGTLPRLMSTPTSTGEIILGKMGGTFLTGVLQFAVLVLASTIIFRITWGEPLGLITIMLLTVFAASGLGALLTTFARNENQAGVIGGAVALVFGALGGSFFPASGLSGIVNVASKLTLNRWAMDGFNKLTQQGAGLLDILLEAGVLAAIGLVTYVLALLGFQRRFVK